MTEEVQNIATKEAKRKEKKRREMKTIGRVSLLVVLSLCVLVVVDAHICVWQPHQRGGPLSIEQPGDPSCYRPYPGILSFPFLSNRSFVRVLYSVRSARLDFSVTHLSSFFCLLSLWFLLNERILSKLLPPLLLV